MPRALMPSPFRAVIESIFQIVDKDGVTRPFKLNSVQQKLDEEWADASSFRKPVKVGSRHM
jgi:hypothetical protein